MLKLVISILLIIYLALYLLIFIFDIKPLFKAGKKRTMSVYLTIFILTLVINILFESGVKFPSIGMFISTIIDQVFKVK